MSQSRDSDMTTPDLSRAFTYTANMYSFYLCPTFHSILTVRFTFNCLIQSNVELSYSKKPVNWLYNYSTILGAAIKCKPYSETTVENRTQLKTLKITSDIFAV